MKRTYEDREALQAYFHQMAGFSRLTAAEEQAAATRLTATSRRLRICLLSSDFMLEKVAHLLERLQRRELRLDYTMGFSTNNFQERGRVANCLPTVLEEVRRVLDANRRDFANVVRKSLPLEQRRQTWRCMSLRRRYVAVPIDRIGVRTRHLQRWQRQLEALSAEIQQRRREIDALGQVGAEGKAGDARHQLRALMCRTRHSAPTLRRHVERCQRLERDYESARHLLVSSNLRLVVAIANRFRGQGVSFLDLIQEGNAGLLHAVDRWSPDGGKFTTYATWFVRQAVRDAVTGQSRAIRLPECEWSRLRRVQAALRGLAQADGRRPEIALIAEKAGISTEQAERVLRVHGTPLSLDCPLNGQAESLLGEFLVDHRPVPLAVELARGHLKSQLWEALMEVSERQRTVLSLRYGLLDGCQRTLDEVGRLLSLTREGVRQAEIRAIACLRRSPGSGVLQDFADAPALV